MAQVVVVIKSMATTKCGGSFMATLGQKSRNLLSFLGTECSVSCNDIHDILWLLYAPDIIFDSTKHSRDVISATNILSVKVFKDVISWNKHGPKATLLD